MPRNFWYSLGRSMAATYAHFMLNLDIAGREKIPEGSKLIAANHPSTTDPFYLSLLIPQPIDMMLIDSAFRAPVFGAYLRRARQICVVRGEGQAAFVEARRRLENQRIVALFPEGNVTPFDGSALAPRTGVVRLAMLTGAPIVPVGIALQRDRIRHTQTIGRRRSLHGHLYLRGPYAMTVGEPLHFRGDATDAAGVAEATATLMAHIGCLAQASEYRLKA